MFIYEKGSSKIEQAPKLYLFDKNLLLILILIYLVQSYLFLRPC